MRILIVILAAASLCSCGQNAQPKAYQVNRSYYRQANPTDTRIRVSLHDQMAWLIDGQGRVVLKTTVSTGVPGHETPQGTFKVLERMEDKRSNRYGQYVDKTTRKVVVKESWKHVGPPPEGTEYQGISMPYWMRLTWYGVGMHVGKFPYRTRCSFGCIRVYKKAQPLIYKKTQKGTEVEIVPHSLIKEMYPNENFRVIPFL